MATPRFLENLYGGKAFESEFLGLASCIYCLYLTSVSSHDLQSGVVEAERERSRVCGRGGEGLGLYLEDSKGGTLCSPGRRGQPAPEAHAKAHGSLGSVVRDAVSSSSEMAGVLVR